MLGTHTATRNETLHSTRYIHRSVPDSPDSNCSRLCSGTKEEPRDAAQPGQVEKNPDALDHLPPSPIPPRHPHRLIGPSRAWRMFEGNKRLSV